MLPSIYDRGAIQVESLGAITTGATHADVLFELGAYQRFVLFLLGTGSDPVGAVEVYFKSKVGVSAAVPLVSGRAIHTAYVESLGDPLENHAVSSLTTGGKYVIAATITDSPLFQFAFMFDVPVLAPAASQDDAVDQLAIGVKNLGSGSFTGSLVMVFEEPRY